MKRIALYMAVCATGLLATESGGVVRADTLSMSMGMQSIGGQHVCNSYGDNAATVPGFMVGQMGVYKSTNSGPLCNAAFFVTPLFWDRFTSAGTTRPITVRRHLQDASGFISCMAVIMDTSGSVVSLDAESFTTVGSYSSITLYVNNVTSGNTGFVSCSASPGAGFLLGLDYSA